MTPQELVDHIKEHFNIDDIEGLCFNLGIDHEEIAGDTLGTKARNLVLFCKRHGRLDELVGYCAKSRPNTSWRRISSQTEFSNPSKPNYVTNQIDANNVNIKSKSSMIWGGVLVTLFIISAIVYGVGDWERIKGFIQSNIESPETITPLPIPTDTLTPTFSTTTPPPETISEPITTPILSTVEATNQPMSSPTDTPIYTPTINIINGYTYVLIPAKRASDQTNEVDEFWIGAYEITNRWFAIYLNRINSSNKCSNGSVCFDSQAPTARISRQNGQWVVAEGYENHPVTEVTWYGADDYCRAIEGRLPTSSEWIHAASWNPATNNVMPYPWGNSLPTDKFANYNNHINDTQPVGSYPSGRTPLGAYDMLGNVWEFIANTQGTNRTAFGGGWNTPQNQLIIGTSYSVSEHTTSSNLGFRCAR